VSERVEVGTFHPACLEFIIMPSFSYVRPALPNECVVNIGFRMVLELP